MNITLESGMAYGVYEILVFQKIAGLCNADSIGYVENFLKWRNGEFVIVNQYVGIDGTIE